MAVKKRRGAWYTYFRPFKDRQIGVKLDVENKTEAKAVEVMLLRACRTGDYGALDPATREVAARMFRSQKWRLPEALQQDEGRKPQQELTWWRACELFLKYPPIRDSKTKVRYAYALQNLTLKFGKEKPIRELWAPDIRVYQADRLGEGASPATVNRETGTLSRVFGVLMELKLADANPCRLVRLLPTKSSEREVYLSLATVEAIAARCPVWFQRIIWTAFYTGARRGEILELRRSQVNLARRILTLSSAQTKEAAGWKRIPVHKSLVPVMEDALRIPSMETDRVFLVQDAKGIRPLTLETAKNPWSRACERLGLEKPWPRFHDLRATWKTNSRRSGVHPEIEQAIMGHSQRKRTVHERYGRISDEELLAAVDAMSFSHGPTEILVSR